MSSATIHRASFAECRPAAVGVCLLAYCLLFTPAVAGSQDNRPPQVSANSTDVLLSTVGSLEVPDAGTTQQISAPTSTNSILPSTKEENPPIELNAQAEKKDFSPREEQMLVAIRSKLISMIGTERLARTYYYTLGVITNSRTSWSFEVFRLDAKKETSLCTGRVNLSDYSVAFSPPSAENSGAGSGAVEDRAFKPMLPPEDPDIEGPGPHYDRATRAIEQGLIARGWLGQKAGGQYMWLDMRGSGWQLPIHVMVSVSRGRFGSGIWHITRKNLEITVNPYLED